MADLVDRLALVRGEHMHDDDELQVADNATQSRWNNHPPTKRHASAASPQRASTRAAQENVNLAVTLAFADQLHPRVVANDAPPPDGQRRVRSGSS